MGVANSYVSNDTMKHTCLYAIVAQPYVDGIANLKAAWKGIHLNEGMAPANSSSKSLCSRCKHILAGLALLIPFINAIVLRIFKAAFKTAIPANPKNPLLNRVAVKPTTQPDKTQTPPAKPNLNAPPITTTITIQTPPKKQPEETRTPALLTPIALPNPQPGPNALPPQTTGQMPETTPQPDKNAVPLAVPLQQQQQPPATVNAVVPAPAPVPQPIVAAPIPPPPPPPPLATPPPQPTPPAALPVVVETPEERAQKVFERTRQELLNYADTAHTTDNPVPMPTMLAGLKDCTECGLKPVLRGKLIDEKFKKSAAKLPKNRQIRYVSVGSGQGLQDWINVANLVKLGVKKLEIHLIDEAYDDDYMANAIQNHRRYYNYDWQVIKNAFTQAVNALGFEKVAINFHTSIFSYQAATKNGGIDILTALDVPIKERCQVYGLKASKLMQEIHRLEPSLLYDEGEVARGTCRSFALYQQTLDHGKMFGGTPDSDHFEACEEGVDTNGQTISSLLGRVTCMENYEFWKHRNGTYGPFDLNRKPEFHTMSWNDVLRRCNRVRLPGPQGTLAEVF